MLKVSNGVCEDSSFQTVNIGNELKAAFDVTNTLCPEDSATFINSSIGNIVSYSWDFGNGNASSLETPAPQHYLPANAEKNYIVRLVVKNNLNCLDTSTKTIKVLRSCYIAVPNAFTPNGDGVNDYLYPLNAFKAGDLDFKVYNRTGQLVFHTTDWTERWDGTIKGQPQDSGVYVWMLSFINTDTGQKVFQKGSSMLIR
jgi:gliding motility-associated-like protein